MAVASVDRDDPLTITTGDLTAETATAAETALAANKARDRDDRATFTTTMTEVFVERTDKDLWN